MRKHMILNIFKKEIKDIFRDKKTIVMMVLLPVLLYPVLMLLSSQVMMYTMKNIESTVYQVGAKEADFDQAVFKELSQKEDYEQIQWENEAYDKTKLEDKRIDAFIVREGTNYTIYMNSSIEESSQVETKLQSFLKDYREALTRQRLEKEGYNAQEVLEPITFESVDTARNEQKAGQFLSMILPLILMMGILLGALYPAIDVMAGEKERGTIETLLTLPVTNMELIFGKFFAVALVAILSAVLNMLSILASGLMLVSSLAPQLESFSLDVGAFIGPFVMTALAVLIYALVVTAASMCVCAMAKSFKEAQNYSTPLMLVLLLPAYASMIPSVKLNSVTASIPVVNISLLIKSVLNFEFNLGATVIVLVTNIGFLILALLLLAKMFNSEDVLFGSGKEFAILQRRYNIEQGTMPTPSDSLIVFVVALLSLVYIGGPLQAQFGFGGLALTQFMMLAISLGFGTYLKTDFKKTFSFKVPSFKGLIGAGVLWIGTFYAMNALSAMLLPLSPENQKLAEELQAAIMHDNLWINLLVVAVLPGICEELLFRGFIYKGLESKGKHPVRAILVTGLLFGMMHLDFIRIIPTALLGIAFCYIVYKTGSIFLCMLMHFLNNGIVVVLSHYGLVGGEVMPTFSQCMVQLILGLGVAAIGIGILNIGKPIEEEQ